MHALALRPTRPPSAHCAKSAAFFDPAIEAAVRASQRRFFPDRIDGTARVGMMEALDDLLAQIAELEED